MTHAKMPHSPIQLIVGLGNPGESYAKTRHNAGAWLIHALASQDHLRLQPHKACKAALVKRPDGQWLMAPTTFMNDSGTALQAVMQYYKIPAESVLVAHDELDFTPGTARLKWAGGHGGHNGLRDIIRLIGDGFWRLRLGIGHPGHKDRVHGYVLKAPNAADRQQIEQAIDQALGVIAPCLAGDFEQAMRSLHGEG